MQTDEVRPESLGAHSEVTPSRIPPLRDGDPLFYRPLAAAAVSPTARFKISLAADSARCFLGSMETVLAETVLANIAVYSWWCTEGLRNFISICNCMAAESAIGLIDVVRKFLTTCALTRLFSCSQLAYGHKNADREKLSRVCVAKFH